MIGAGEKRKKKKNTDKRAFCVGKTFLIDVFQKGNEKMGFCVKCIPSDKSTGGPYVYKKEK